jgi:CRP/FNR family transcriptional regulator, nitrogen oxide reductase regulator
MDLSAIEVVDHSIRTRFLDNIPHYDRKIILERAQERSVTAKDVIIHGGGRASAVYLLRNGRIKYSRVTEEGKELLLWLLTPGDVFGIATILNHPPGYLGTATAVTDCDLVVWHDSAILQLSKHYPELCRNALRITLEYLAAYARRHGRLITESAPQRLAYTLVQFAHRAGRVYPTGVEVEITNEQLGGLADVGLFTTSRLLGDWERSGLIRKERGRIQIETPEKLLET